MKSLEPKMPDKKDFLWAALIIAGSMILGLLVNQINPRGFNYMRAAGWESVQ